MVTACSSTAILSSQVSINLCCPLAGSNIGKHKRNASFGMLVYRSRQEPHDIEFLYITVVSEVINKCSWTSM
jgi:hypothetical protein